MNIDKDFLVIYATSGVLFGAKYFWPTGWLGLVCAGLIVYMLIKNKFYFEHRAVPNSAKIMIILLAAFFLNWWYKITFLGKPAIDQYVMFYLSGLPFWVMEEAIFRGMLWMSLEALGWRPFRIVLVQAFVFSILHIQYVLSNPFLFWVLNPLLSVFDGVLVWKYKSITPSTIAHILFNLR
jgi:Type II CAAX prenyl endopeptidase Rce1-like